MPTLNRTTFSHFTPTSSTPDMTGNANKALLTTGGGMYWGAVPIAGGGTGQVTAQAGLDALTTGNLNLSGAASRIRSDFSNPLVASRTSFQTSTTNGNTIIQAIPNGTSVNSMFTALNNSDPTNSSYVAISLSSSESRLVSSAVGSGTVLPLTLYVGSTKLLTAESTGTVTVGSQSVSNTSFDTVGSGNGIIQNRVYNDLAAVNAQSRILLQTKTAGSALTLSQMDNNGSPWALLTSNGAATPIYYNFATHIFGNNAGTEHIRFASAGQIGIGGANYGTAGQVIVSSGAGSSVSWGTISGATLTGTVPLTAGGTGASIASQALINLGVEVAGRNSQGAKTVEPIAAGVPSNAIGIDGDIRYQY